MSIFVASTNDHKPWRHRLWWNVMLYVTIYSIHTCRDGCWYSHQRPCYNLDELFWSVCTVLSAVHRCLCCGRAHHCPMTDELYKHWWTIRIISKKRKHEIKPSNEFTNLKQSNDSPQLIWIAFAIRTTRFKLEGSMVTTIKYWKRVFDLRKWLTIYFKWRELTSRTKYCVILCCH